VTPPRSPKRGSRAYWICQASGWSLYVLVTTYQLRELGPVIAVAQTVSAALIGVGLTHAFRRFGRPRRWSVLGPGAVALRVVLASLGLAVVFVGLLLVTAVFVFQEHGKTPLWLVAGSAVMRWSMVFFIWLAIYSGYGLIEQRQTSEIRRLEAENAQKVAELGALRAQLNPHFLFNSLNSIRALVADDPAIAQDAITRTARILRYTLESSREPMVTLGRELEVVDDYLALEALRLQDRLRVERRISDGARSIPIPIMLVQLLVENALKHGIAQLPAGGTLRIAADVKDGELGLEVENPRPPVAVRLEGESSSGVGIANVTERLRVLFGESAALDLDLSRPDRALARVRVPIGAPA
jgi:hypothetical protein